MSSDDEDARFEKYSWYLDDWHRSTARALFILDPWAYVAFRELIDASWRMKLGMLPSNEDVLAALSGIPREQWERVKGGILPYFPLVNAGYRRNRRVYLDMQKALATREAFRKGGFVTSSKRWTADSRAVARLPARHPAMHVAGCVAGLPTPDPDPDRKKNPPTPRKRGEALISASGSPERNGADHGREEPTRTRPPTEGVNQPAGQESRIPVDAQAPASDKPRRPLGRLDVAARRLNVLGGSVLRVCRDQVSTARELGLSDDEIDAAVERHGREGSAFAWLGIVRKERRAGIKGQGPERCAYCENAAGEPIVGTIRDRAACRACWAREYPSGRSAS